MAVCGSVPLRWICVGGSTIAPADRPSLMLYGLLPTVYFIVRDFIKLCHMLLVYVCCVCSLGFMGRDISKFFFIQAYLVPGRPGRVGHGWRTGHPLVGVPPGVIGDGRLTLRQRSI